MENRRSVDQKLADALELLLAHPEIFTRQGTVVASWRSYRGRRLGPYYRLTYRQEGRQRSVYLGNCSELASQLRDTLTEMQQPLATHRAYRRHRAQVAAGLRQAKKVLNAQLRAYGMQLKGYEIRIARENAVAAMRG